MSSRIGKEQPSLIDSLAKEEERALFIIKDESRRVDESYEFSYEPTEEDIEHAKAIEEAIEDELLGCCSVTRIR